MNINYKLLIFKNIKTIYSYYEFILSANVYFPKYIDNILGNIYFENNDNNKAKAKNTNVIWWAKKNGTNCGIYNRLNYVS